MNADVEQFARTWANKEERPFAKDLARAYVDAHRAELSLHLAHLTLEELVELVKQYRKAGREEDRIVTDMWLLSEYDPQIITGTAGGAVQEAERLTGGIG